MSDPTTSPDDGYASEAAQGSAGFQTCAIRALSQARIQISILSQVLDRSVYGTSDFIDPLITFLLAHERAQLRVLLRRPDVVMKSGHRLVELGRRLSSRVLFRELSAERQQTEQELLVVDESAVLLRESPLEVTSRYWPHAPLLARARLREFETLWQDATPATETHSLNL